MKVKKYDTASMQHLMGVLMSEESKAYKREHRVEHVVGLVALVGIPLAAVGLGIAQISGIVPIGDYAREELTKPRIESKAPGRQSHPSPVPGLPCP